MINFALVAERLQDLMLDNNINVKKLSSDLEIAQSLLYRYLRADGLLQTKYLFKLANYFSCSLDYLLGLENEYYKSIYLEIPSFGKRIIELYKKYNITEYRLMKDSKISRTSLHDWRFNLRLPTPENLVILAKYFKCSVDYLVGRI